MDKRLLVNCIVFISILCVSFSSCNNKKKAESKLTGFEMSLTERDTTAVRQLVNQFFEYCEEGRTTDAIAMLYEANDSDIYAEPQLLDNERIASMTRLLNSFPIVRHNIDYIKFSETYSNEVKVTAIIAEPEGDMPEVKTVFYFRPYDYLSGWRLCIIDTNSNLRTIVDDADKDSLQKQEQQRQAMKAEAEKKSSHSEANP